MLIKIKSFNDIGKILIHVILSTYMDVNVNDTEKYIHVITKYLYECLT